MVFFQFDPRKGFFSQRLVLATLAITLIWLGVSLALYFSTVSWSGIFCGTASCLNVFFLDVVGVPLKGSAIGLAILGLLAAHHRSVQSAHATKLTHEQNAFSNHYSHKREFEEFCDKTWKNSASCTIQFERLYRCLYPNSNTSQPDQLKIDLNLFHQIEICITKIDMIICNNSQKDNPLAHNWEEEYSTFTSDKTLQNVSQNGLTLTFRMEKSNSPLPNELSHLDIADKLERLYRRAAWAGTELLKFSKFDPFVDLTFLQIAVSNAIDRKKQEDQLNTAL